MRFLTSRIFFTKGEILKTVLVIIFYMGTFKLQKQHKSSVQNLKSYKVIHLCEEQIEI